MLITNNNESRSSEVKIKEKTEEIPQNTLDDLEEETVKPPDGGWGWVVVFASFMVHVIADGVTYTIGIFYVEFLKYFHSSKGTTAWIPSIMVGTTFCIGPFASALMNRYGCRAVAITGAVVATFGLLISTIAPNVLFLFFSIGLCAGLGFGLMYVPAIVCVTCYFEKRRAFATGIAVCGSGFGTFAMAPLTELLVETFAWKGAMLVVSGLVLNCILFGALFRPLEAPSGQKRNKKIQHQEKFPSEPAKLSKAGLPRKELSEYQPSSDELDHLLEQPNGGINHSTAGVVSSVRKIYPSNRIRNDSICSEMNGDVLLSNGTNPRFCLEKPTRSRSDAAFINTPYNRNMEKGKPQLVVTSSHDLRHPSHLVQHHHQTGAAHREGNNVRGHLYRKDLFYSGSLMNIPEYKSDPLRYRSLSKVSTPQPKKSFMERPKWKILQLFTCSTEMKEVLVEMMDFSLLKNPIFLMFAMSNFFTNIGFNVPFVYIKDRAIDMGIAQDEEASILLSVIGIANTAGRILLGYISDKTWCNRLYLYNLCLTACGVATAFSSFATTYAWMGVYSAVFGITAGAYVSLTSVILVDLLGIDKLTNAFGLLLLFEGVACLIGPPITGCLYDAFLSYDPGFYVCGAMIAFSGLMLFAIPFMKKCSDQKDANGIVTVSLDESTLPSPAIV